jgi:hypothetical protein
MGDVINLNAPTVADIPAEKVLQSAIDAKLDMAIVIGETPDGMLYHASSTADVPAMLFALKVFEHQLMRLVEE